MHLAVFGAAVVAGWALADGRLPARPVQEYWREAATIAGHNAGALFLLALMSLLTVGVGGLVLFGLNGYAFGLVLGMMTPEARPWAMVYAPLEVASFACASAAVTRVSHEGVRWLRDNRSISTASVRTAVRAIGLAVVGLALSALLEAVAIHRTWGVG